MYLFHSSPESSDLLSLFLNCLPPKCLESEKSLIIANRQITFRLSRLKTYSATNNGRFSPKEYMVGDVAHSLSYVSSSIALKGFLMTAYWVVCPEIIIALLPTTQNTSFFFFFRKYTLHPFCINTKQYFYVMKIDK